MADYSFTMPNSKIKEIFNESVCSEELPTDEEFEQFMEYLNENPEEVIKGMALNFWCMGGRM